MKLQPVPTNDCNDALRASAASPSAAPVAEEAKSMRRKVMCAFDEFATRVTRWAGSPIAFTLAVAMVLVWVLCGPLFHYSETWQLVINTGTTIVTFLMVFLIQQSQNKDSQALHLKLDELLHSIKEAHDDMIDIEHLSEEDLQTLAEEFKRRQNG